MAASNWSVVESNLDRSRRIRRKIEHARRFVRTGSNDFGSILVDKKQLRSDKVHLSFYVKLLTGDQQQFNTGASWSKKAFPSLCP